MTVTFLSSVFSEMELYQVRLDEEIKDEIDLSIEDSNQPVAGTSNKVANPATEPISRSNYHIQGLQEEEIENNMLMEQKVDPNVVYSLDNVSSPCIGKRSQQEFVFHRVHGDLYIFSAFWDARWNDFDNKRNRTFIRMMGINNKDNIDPPLSCLFYIRGAYHIIPAYDYEMCEGHNKMHGGFIYSCEVPVAVKTRVCSVLVAYGDTADPKWATRIPVSDTQPQQVRHKFSQCVPPLFGKIDEDRLIEFIELSRMLGSEHLTFYNMRAPDNIKNVLHYYHIKGIATIIPWPLPQIYTGASLWYHGQMVAIQDCLYRNMVFSDFVAFNDLDEHFIPHVHRTWHDLINAIDQSNKYIGYVFKSSFFDLRQNKEPYKWIKDFKYLTTVQDVMRSEMISKFRNKCIVRPRDIFEKGIHHVSKPIKASLETYDVAPEMALLHHYRQCAATHGQNCDNFVQDRRAWKFAARLHERVQFSKSWIDKFTS